ncbi:AglZ/HisF2 family acetamidino modification protein [Candidatus Omnitrophota bacterium]
MIPCLLLRGDGLVKTVKFRKPKYLGDPINVVKIFNDKEVDELIFCDIRATLEGARPPFDRMEQIASECFMPLGYSGGVRNLEDMERLFNIGIEKVAINTYAVDNPTFVRKAAEHFGNQSVVVSMDVKKKFFGGYEVCTKGGSKRTGLEPVSFAVEMETMGAGEILLNSIDRDGMMLGYDIDLIRRVTSAVDIPVVACGGAGGIQDLTAAINGGASAAGAGSMFVFNGPHHAVLISYPNPHQLKESFGKIE